LAVEIRCFFVFCLWICVNHRQLAMELIRCLVVGLLRYVVWVWHWPIWRLRVQILPPLPTFEKRNLLI